MEKNIYYYLSLPYTVEIREDNDEWFAKIVELEGCMTCADTKEEAYKMINDALISWLETAIEDGIEIPEPDLDYLNNSRLK